MKKYQSHFSLCPCTRWIFPLCSTFKTWKVELLSVSSCRFTWPILKIQTVVQFRSSSGVKEENITVYGCGKDHLRSSMKWEEKGGQIWERRKRKVSFFESALHFHPQPSNFSSDLHHNLQNTLICSGLMQCESFFSPFLNSEVYFCLRGLMGVNVCSHGGLREICKSSLWSNGGSYI